MINITCDNALLAGFTAGQKVIGDRTIREVINQLEGRSVPEKKRSRLFLVVLILLLIFGGLLLWWGVQNSIMIIPWLGK